MTRLRCACTHLDDLLLVRALPGEAAERLAQRILLSHRRGKRLFGTACACHRLVALHLNQRMRRRCLSRRASPLLVGRLALGICIGQLGHQPEALRFGEFLLAPLADFILRGLARALRLALLAPSLPLRGFYSQL